MPAGLYADLEIIERWSPTVAAGSLNGFLQPFIAPCDMEIQGLIAVAGTAPGGSTSMSVNLAVTPTSQSPTVSAYNAWTAANAPVIVGTATKSFATSTTATVVKNVPYALNYPLPGPSGTAGYTTAQSTSQTTETPVTSPPTQALYQTAALVAPDNTYSDFNGITQSAGYLHAGDSVLVVVGANVGSAASMEVVIYALKR